MNKKELKEFLDFKAAHYEQPHFLAHDPIQIPHLFHKKEDIEISGFLVATIAWGNRLSIIKSGKRILELMGNDPFHFVMEHQEKDLALLIHLFTALLMELICVFIALQSAYRNHGGLENLFFKALKQPET